MKHVTSEQKTFGKATKQLIKNLVPTASSSRRINKDFVIRDSKGKTVATWHKQRNKNGLIIIH